MPKLCLMMLVTGEMNILSFLTIKNQDSYENFLCLFKHENS